MDELLDLANKDLRVVGIKQVLKSLDRGEIRCVILASDADSFFKSCVIEETEDKQVKLVTVKSRDELAKLCKIDVPTAVAGLKVKSK